jgi:hypothetical protein
MISNISVLNTVQDNALDFYVDADGFLNVTGCPKVKATNPKVNTIGWADATAGVATFAFTAVNNYTYNFRVTGYDAGNNRITIPFYYTTGVSGADATSIANAVRAMIAASSIGAQFASIAGTTTVVLTATVANPLISFENFNKDPNMTTTAASVTTAGVEAIGLGSDLLVAYGGFAGSSAIVPTASYFQYEVTVNPPVMFGGQAITEVGSTTYVVLLKKDATTATGSVNNATFNIALLNAIDDLGVAKTIGTITGLARGYRVIVQSSSVSTATVPTLIPTTAVTVTITAATAPALGNVVASASCLTLFKARQGDVLVAALTTNFATQAATTLVGVTSVTAASGDNAVGASGVIFKLISLRNIPS